MLTGKVRRRIVIDKKSTIMTAADNAAPGIEFRRFRVRGTSVAAIDLERACDLIGQLATAGQGSYVTVTGAHGIVESVYSDRVREAHQQATMVVPDGMPLVWLGRLLGFNSIGRVYGPDLMASVFARKELRQLKHYFYGSTPAIVDRLTTTLRSQFGEFTLVGAYSPPIRPVGFRRRRRFSIAYSRAEATNHLGWPFDAQTGNLVARSYGQDRKRRRDWSWSSIRSRLGHDPASTALDSALGFGMAFPDGRGAEKAGSTIFFYRATFFILHGGNADHRQPAIIEKTRFIEKHSGTATVGLIVRVALPYA